jgi:heat shock protein HtpX
MRLSLQLSAMLMGFFCLCYIGWRMFKLALYGRSSSKEKKTPPLFVIGLVVVAFGALGWLFGSFLKSMISKEREYLADACSAQFTRNPQALVRALRKIANFPMHDMPTEGMAYSHLYFNSSGFFDQIFATHPPLEKRISALESWQG